MQSVAAQRAPATTRLPTTMPSERNTIPAASDFLTWRSCTLLSGPPLLPTGSEAAPQRVRGGPRVLQHDATARREAGRC